MPRVIRVLMEIELRAPRRLENHVYLREAVALRPDLHDK